MGHKVNPVGLRLGFNKNWTAQWFVSKGSFAKNLQEDSTIKSIIEKRFSRSGLSNIEIIRHRGDILINLYTTKPGVVIGRSGAGAQELKATIEKNVFKNYETSNRPLIRINIIEMKNADLSARVVAENIASQIERRISVKRAMKQAIERTMEKNAKGIKIRISGRLGGAEIARSEISSQGSVPLQTIRSNIDYALAEAHTTYGIIGIKVWINLGEKEDLPIEVNELPVKRSKNR